MKNKYTNPNSNPRFWTLEEISILRTYYNHICIEELQTKLFNVNSYLRSFNTISVKAYKLGLTKKVTQNSWSQLEIDYLINHYESMTLKEISKNLKRTLFSVNRKFNSLGLQKKDTFLKYSDFEIQFLKDNYKDSFKSLAKYLNRDINSIKYNLDKLGLLIVSKYKFYTEDEIQYLKDNSFLSCNKLALKLNRSKASIRDKMKQLQIYKPRKKSKSYIFSELEIIKVKYYYKNHTVIQISKMINRDIKELNSLIKRLKLRK